MSEPWTPGPWEIQPKPRSPIRAYRVEVRHRQRYGLGHGIARVNLDDDARLIAAAPEMAELLAEMAALASDESGRDSWMGRAHSLISRIRGEAEVTA